VSFLGDLWAGCNLPPQRLRLLTAATVTAVGALRLAALGRQRAATRDAGLPCYWLAVMLRVPPANENAQAPAPGASEFAAV
jgi:hypothetical protein